MTLWQILVPRKWNNGKPIRLKHHKQWDAKVRAIAGGLTILVPTVKGEWVSPDGDLYIDSTIPVMVSCSEEQIEQIMDMTAEHYKQLAVLAFQVSTNVKIRHYDEKV